MKAASRPPPIQPNQTKWPWTRSPRRTRRRRSVGFCSPRPRPWSWRGAFVGSATCPARRGSSWPGSSAWLRPRSRSGFRTTATKWREAGQRERRSWSYTSLRFCAESLCQSWSGTGNHTIPAYLTRIKVAVLGQPLHKQRPSRWPTSLFSIRPRLPFPPDTSTFPARRPPDTPLPGETFGATRFRFILSSEVSILATVQCTSSFRMASNVFWMFPLCRMSSNLNILDSH